jgi:hypothetical protein
MTSQRKSQVVTLAALAGLALVAVVARRGLFAPGTANSGPSPQDAVYAMLDAARAGNVRAYLASYTGDMSRDLRRSVAESTEQAFAAYLRNSNAAIKGIAVSTPQFPTLREATVKIEYVYVDRNEAQTLYMAKERGRWKIARVDGSERVKTLVPYGTPIQ